MPTAFNTELIYNILTLCYSSVNNSNNNGSYHIQEKSNIYCKMYLFQTLLQPFEITHLVPLPLHDLRPRIIQKSSLQSNLLLYRGVLLWQSSWWFHITISSKSYLGCCLHLNASVIFGQKLIRCALKMQYEDKYNSDFK